MTVAAPLAAQQVEHYRLFGFVVLRGYLEDVAMALRAEVEQALREAYGERFDDRIGDGGIEGHYLPMMADRTPISRSLVADDPRLLGAASQLLDGPVLPDHGEGVLYFGQAPWHDDCGFNLTAVKMAAYLDPLTADTGALRLLPRSHLPGTANVLRRYERAHARLSSDADWEWHINGFPAYIAETRPGDVIAFAVHTWHASYHGHDRLAWTVEYLREPGTPVERTRFLDWMRDSCDQADRRYDHARFPLYRDWIAGAETYPTRRAAITRMAELGVFELPGADL